MNRTEAEQRVRNYIGQQLRTFGPDEKVIEYTGTATDVATGQTLHGLVVRRHTPNKAINQWGFSVADDAPDTITMTLNMDLFTEIFGEPVKK